MTKIQRNARIYKVCLHNEIAKIHKRVLSHYSYTHTSTHVHSCTRAHVHVCDMWRSHTPLRDIVVLSVPHQYKIIKLFFIHFNSK